MNVALKGTKGPGIVLVVYKVTKRIDMILHTLMPEKNANPVVILTRYGKIFYANIPAMILLNLENLDIGDKIPRQSWKLALSSFINGIFTFNIGKINYKWTVNVLRSRFIYLQADAEIEPNLLFTRK